METLGNRQQETKAYLVNNVGTTAPILPLAEDAFFIQNVLHPSIFQYLLVKEGVVRS